jgi:hypothetical protein
MGGEAKKANSAIMKEVSAQADMVIDSMIPESVPGYKEARESAKMVKGEEIARMAQSLGRWAAMKAYFKTPEGLEGEKAEEYVQQKAMMLSVDALMRLEKDLKLGDDAQSRDAARDILDMTGQRRKQESPAAQSVIVLMQGQSGLSAPWFQRKGDPSPQEKMKLLEAASVTAQDKS